jgi:lambda family phage minor tail protein L
MSDSQLVTTGLVTLYQLDTSFMNGPTHYFTSASDFDTAIYWGGQQYFPLPMDAQGFEQLSKGALPTPSITISNLFGAGNTLLDAYNGLVGAQVTRILTKRRFLDDGESPDPNAYITRDVFVVAQKTSHDAIRIVFKLASRMDQEGAQIPRRQILRDVCQHSYRFWDTTINAFNYSKATCPYTASGFWTPLDQATDPQHDQCSRSMTGCTLRFGRWSALPARFFPGVGKVK